MIFRSHRGSPLRFIQRMLTRGSVVALLGLMSLPISAGTPMPSVATPTIGSLPETFLSEFGDAFHDYARYWTAPLTWNDTEWGTFWTIMGTTGALIIVDRPIYTTFDKKSWTPVKQSLDIFHQLGQWQYPGIVLAGIYTSSFVLEDSKLERASRIAIKSFVFQTLVNQGLKNLIYRTKIDDPYDFRIGPPNWRIPSDGAFPSGHASNTWAVMSAFAIAYRDDPIIPSLCYGAATISSCLLITNQDHWISDIVLGAALGYYSAEWMASIDDHRYRQRASNSGSSPTSSRTPRPITIQPVMSSDITGIGISVPF